MSEKPILRVEQLYHNYGNQEVLHGVDFDLFEGEIHAITGPHLSGKTTLGKILTGAERMQRGSIYYKENQVQNYTIRKAMSLGIYMGGKESSYVDTLNAIDNIYLGKQPFLISATRKRRMIEEAEECCSMFGCKIPMDCPLYNLNEQEKQMINLLRLLINKPKIAILDEIGASFPSNEMVSVFKFLKSLQAKGISIVYITSNFNDLFKVANRVTILDGGRRKGTEKIAAIDPVRIHKLTVYPGFFLDNEENLNFIDAYQKSIIEELPVGEILVNNELEVVFANQIARSLLCLQGPSNQRSGIDRVFDFLDDEKFIDFVHAIDRGKSITFNGEKFGNRFLKISVSAIRLQTNIRIGSNIFVEDVSFDYQTKEYLMNAKKASNTAMLAAGVAHEIKNPIGIIQNYVELLKLSVQGADNLRNLDCIDRELHRITSIIGNLLSFSRVRPTQMESFNVIQVLEEVLLLLEHKFSEKNINVIKSFVSVARISGNENMLKQLFLNLLMNAIEAVPYDGIIEITVNSNTEKKVLTIYISDNGVGISEKVRDKIFSPFFTTKITRTNIGLGLSICQHIVELHKGAIKFFCIPGERTTFTITFPMLD